MAEKGEVVHMLLTEYDEKRHLRNTFEEGRKEGLEEGMEQGREQGRKQGREEKLREQVHKSCPEASLLQRLRRN